MPGPLPLRRSRCPYRRIRHTALAVGAVMLIIAAVLAVAADVNFASNMAIVAGYLLVPVTVLPQLPLTRHVQVAGALFFTTCATTHLGMALNFEHSYWMLYNHAVQGVAVIWFVLGFWSLLAQANQRLEREPVPSPPAAPAGEPGVGDGR